MSGVEQQAVNFSINQIFNSAANTTVPLSNTLNALSLNGKTFGIYTSSARTIIHSSSFRSDLLPVFIGYFGFGTSGILNSTNRGCPIRIGITSNGNIDAQLSEEQPGLHLRLIVSIQLHMTLELVKQFA